MRHSMWRSANTTKRGKTRRRRAGGQALAVSAPRRHGLLRYMAVRRAAVHRAGKQSKGGQAARRQQGGDAEAERGNC